MIEPEHPGKQWAPNEGEQPKRTRGKRVHVILANGMHSKPMGGTAPPGWAADTSRWTVTGHPFDIAWWRKA